MELALAHFNYKTTYEVFLYPNCLYCELKDLDIEQCMSTPSMSCERVMRTECRFTDDNTTYISHWPRQKCPKE